MSCRELDPVPNPPYFSSHVIKATLDYLSKCHSANPKSLVAILSKTPVQCLIYLLLNLCFSFLNTFASLTHYVFYSWT